MLDRFREEPKGRTVPDDDLASPRTRGGKDPGSPARTADGRALREAPTGKQISGTGHGGDWNFYDPHHDGYDSCGYRYDCFNSWWWYSGFYWNYYGGCYYPYGYGYYFALGFPYFYYCYYRPLYYPGYYPYYPYYPYYYPYTSSVVYHYYPDGAYIEEAPPPVEEAAPEAGEAVLGEGEEADLDDLLAPQGSERQRTSSYFLDEGDRAFREGRYADAVRHYTKAASFAPDEGVMFLVLSDALLATGDYHYASAALRRGLERDPELAKKTVDKHEFYADPKEFDRHLATLAQFVADRPADDEARLLLAANYLFGGAPAAAVELLESELAAELRTQQAGQLILEAARELLVQPGK